MANENGLGVVQAHSVTCKNLRLSSGETLPELKLVYETYGNLASRMAATLSSSRIARIYLEPACHGLRCERRGRMVGHADPDLAKRSITSTSTSSCHRTCSASSYGSTSPAGINPKPRKAVWSRFSGLLAGRHHRHRAAHAGGLAGRGKHLVAVAGISFGGYQAFQWSVTFPDAMSGIIAGRHRAERDRRRADVGRSARAIRRGAPDGTVAITMAVRR